MQVATPTATPRQDTFGPMHQGIQHRSGNGRNTAVGGFQAAASYESMRMDTTRLTLTSSDGTTLSVEKQQLAYTRQGVAVNATGSSVDPKSEMTRHIVAQLRQIKQSVFESLNPQQTGKGEQTRETEEVAQVPEYWNAENTSTRIVDFATQFFSAFDGTKTEYGEIIRDAIEKGFAEAKEILGELPSATNNLIQETHELTMQKLDAWIDKEPADEKARPQATESIAA